MKKHFTHHYEILPEAQRTVWPHLAQFKQHFVLYGGTAIALRLGHRQSIDFDFFSEKPLEHRWIADILPETVNSSILQSGQNTYTVLLQPNDEYVKLSFFGGIDFGRIGEPGYTEDDTLLVASLKDLLATKVKVLMQRIEKRDYIDIAAILSHGLSLADGLAGASSLFGREFSPSDCLRALHYFDEPSLSDLDNSVKGTLKDAVKEVLGMTSLQKLEIKSFSLG